MNKPENHKAVQNLSDYQDMIVDYLNGKLSPEKQHLLEVEMDDDPLLKDALDGLSDMKNQQEIEATVLLLKKKLQDKINHRRGLHHQRPTYNIWIWMIALAVILLVFIGWWVIEVTMFSK